MFLENHIESYVLPRFRFWVLFDDRATGVAVSCKGVISTYLSFKQVKASHIKTESWRSNFRTRPD
jgi:hypothetical protein